MVLELKDALGILIAGLGGAAVGLEREWSGHAGGHRSGQEHWQRKRCRFLPTIGVLIGVKQFRRIVLLGLLAFALACAVSLAWLR